MVKQMCCMFWWRWRCQEIPTTSSSLPHLVLTNPSALIMLTFTNTASSKNTNSIIITNAILLVSNKLKCTLLTIFKQMKVPDQACRLCIVDVKQRQLLRNSHQTLNNLQLGPKANKRKVLFALRSFLVIVLRALFAIWDIGQDVCWWN